MEHKSDEKTSVRMPLEFKWFIILSLSLWLVSIFFIVTQAQHSSRFPYRVAPTILDRPFSDLLVFRDKMSLVHQPDFFTKDYRWIYPAPCVFLYKVIVPSS